MTESKGDKGYLKSAHTQFQKNRKQRNYEQFSKMTLPVLKIFLQATSDKLKNIFLKIALGLL